ncbi:MAG: hypothetical protein KatS3mg045_1849 [Bellilinea sp.]|nr:MAG: hypothetical protein KatS3mg045_1849 [Bellilinea sp.]
MGASARAAGFVTIARPFRAGYWTDVLSVGANPQPPSALRSQRVGGVHILPAPSAPPAVKNTPPPAGEGQGVGASARAAGFVTIARPFRAGYWTDVLSVGANPQPPSALRSQRVGGVHILPAPSAPPAVKNTPPPAGEGQGVGASARAAGFVTIARPFRAGYWTDVLSVGVNPQPPSALRSQRVGGVHILPAPSAPSAVKNTPPPAGEGQGGGGISPRSGLRNYSPALQGRVLDRCSVRGGQPTAAKRAKVAEGWWCSHTPRALRALCGKKHPSPSGGGARGGGISPRSGLRNYSPALQGRVLDRCSVRGGQPTAAKRAKVAEGWWCSHTPLRPPRPRR